MGTMIEQRRDERAPSEGCHTGPSDPTVLDLINTVLVTFPQSIAVTDGTYAFTYEQLDIASNNIAYALIEKGLTKGEYVALFLDKSINTIAAILGVLKAGGVYVPVDVKYPENRVKYMLSDTRARYLITQNDLYTKALSLRNEINDVLIVENLIKTHATQKIPLEPEPHDLAYVIYTSGSTGTPKGVLIQHLALSRYILKQSAFLGIIPEDRILQFSNYSFDASVEQIFLALCNGATLVIPVQDVLMDSDAFVAFINTQAVTHIHATPAFLEFIPVQRYPTLKRIISAGERCNPKLAQAWSAHVDFINKYGPTESTISTHEYRYPHSGDLVTQVPIGRPLPGIVQRILTPEGKSVKIGEIGELYLGGDQLSPGYLNLPETTAHQFVDMEGERFYRTGDLVKLHSDGLLEYMGRADEQLKIRGYRVEPGEIEYHLGRLDGVKRGLVAVKEDDAGIQILVAYVLQDESTEKSNTLSKEVITKWRSELASSLPPHMVPNAWIKLHQIPLTPNKKVDRNALPHPVASEMASIKSAAYSPTQLLVAETWAQVLGVPNVALHDNFFELGGHSLLAMKALTIIRRISHKKAPLSMLLNNPILEDFAKAIDQSADASMEASVYPPDSASKIQHGNTADYRIPMIAPQKEIWLSCQLGDSAANLAYNVSVTLALRGNLDISALSKAIQSLVLRHEALRASVEDQSESLVISPASDVSLQVVSFISESSDSQKLQRYEAFLNAQMRTEFDLNSPPLFKAFLHKFSEEDHRLTIITHHIICDGIAMRVLVRDLATLYNAHAYTVQPALDPAPQLSEFAREHMDFERSDAYQSTLQFWYDQHRDYDTALDLPIDFPRPPVRTYECLSMEQRLATGTLSQLQKLASGAGMSVAAALTAIMEVFLYHRTGQRDITLGLTTAGQYVSGYDDLVGHCVNLLPLRTHVNPELTFSQYLSERRDGIYAAYENQQLTFSELLRHLKIQRDRAQIPLVPFVMTIQADSGPSSTFDGLESTCTSNPSTSQTFELFTSFNLEKSTDSITIHWAYNKQLFAPDTITRMGAELALLIDTVTAKPSVSIGKSLPLPHPFPELEQYTFEYPKGATLLDYIVDRAQQLPTATALWYEGIEMTYRDLDHKSNQLANYLLERGVKRNDLVILCVTPSIEMVIAFLAIWKSGATYVPIDPELPAERLRHIVNKTGANTAILNSETNNLTQLVSLENNIIIDEPSLVAWTFPAVQPTERPAPGDGAYVIYTSGSTGNPKGVLIEHEALVDYYFGLCEHVPAVLECKEYILGSPIYTDLGNTILYGSLLNGGRLHLFRKDTFNDPDYIGRYFAENDIDFLKIVPSHWNYFSKLGIDIAPKKILMLGGEGLPASIVNELLLNGKECIVINEYGPTETTIGKLLHIAEKDRAYGSEIPIGKPYSNSSTYVLNENLGHCPIGVPGELYIGGVGLAAGYLGEPELTANSFSEITVSENKTLRLYKTGDVVRWLPNGEIEYLGRSDQQVKIRGNRIELAEIESQISQLEKFDHCSVLAIGDELHDKQLVAFVVPRAGVPIDQESSIQQLRAVLPEYMVPRHWVTVDSIPLNANGKADKKRLAKSFSPPEKSRAEYVAPETETQSKLVGIWSSCLKVDKEISIVDDFFELGGHSLIAVRIMGQIRQQFHVSLPLATLFEHVTIEKLAKVVDGEVAPLQWDCVIPIRKSGSKPPLFIVHGALLDVMYARLALPHLDPDQPLYGIQGMGLSGKSSPAETIEEIAAHYVTELLRHVPDGPYAIAGYSSGGLIAFEMVNQLKKMGRQVYFLGLFDTYATNNYRSLAGTIHLWRLILAESFYQYGRKTTYKYLRMYAIDKYLIKYLTRTKSENYKHSFPEDFWKFRTQLIYILAVRKYTPTPCHVDATLFQSPKVNSPSDQLSATNGWSAFIKGQLSIMPVSSIHAEMFIPQNIKDSASRLQEALTKAWKNFVAKAGTG